MQNEGVLEISISTHALIPSHLREHTVYMYTCTRKDSPPHTQVYLLLSLLIYLCDDYSLTY